MGESPRPEGRPPLVDNHDWDGNAKRGITFRITDSKPEFQYSNGEWQSLFASAPLTRDIWHHMAVACDSSMVRLYVDGVEDASTRIHGKPLPAKYSLQIGRSPYETKRQFTGTLAEVMLFNRALSAEEVAKLAGGKK